MSIDGKAVKGRGASEQVANRFAERQYAAVHWEGIDEPEDLDGQPTRYIETFAKTIVNKVNSPDLPFRWSINPYQGCEHGCSYCYARPTHEYWGYSAGLDFERIVLLKRNAPELLDKALRSRSWVVEPIVLSGATDPYQPVERKERITRRLLEVASSFRQPVSLITKNALVLRDLDLLQEMAAARIASVAISLTTLDEPLRTVLEPRTSTARNRLKAIEVLSAAGVPVTVMVAPIIPALNQHEVPALLKAAADAGAVDAGYTVLRTNGTVQDVFTSWLTTHFPDRASKVIAQAKAMHGGKLNDAEPGRRMKGDGAYAANVARVFHLMKQRYFKGRTAVKLSTHAFRIPPNGQLDLFR